MLRCPFAEWRPSPNYSPGAIGGHVGWGAHHIVGTLANAESRFMSRAGGASSHFGVGDDGRLVQWVDGDDAAWAMCRGNYTGWLTIEHESPATGDVWRGLTDEQIETDAHLVVWGYRERGVPVRVATEWDSGISYHSANPGPCSTNWGVTGCPGDAIIADRHRIVARALELLGGAPAPVPPAPLPDFDAIAAALAAMRGDNAMTTLVHDGHEQDFSVTGAGVLIHSSYSQAFGQNEVRDEPLLRNMNPAVQPSAIVTHNPAGRAVIVVTAQTGAGRHARIAFAPNDAGVYRWVGESGEIPVPAP